jgi:hypothetical protein
MAVSFLASSPTLKVGSEVIGATAWRRRKIDKSESIPRMKYCVLGYIRQSLYSLLHIFFKASRRQPGEHRMAMRWPGYRPHANHNLLLAPRNPAAGEPKAFEGLLCKEAIPRNRRASPDLCGVRWQQS